jgi:translation initiation factor IF-2
MSEKRVIRINKVLRELNISLERAVDFLKEKNHVIESSPNAKISQEEYDVLCDQFSADKGKKVASQEVSEEKKKEKEALKRELEKELELKRQQEEKQKQEVIKAKAVVTGPKAIGKIDLNPTKSEPKNEANVSAVEQILAPVAEEKPVVLETPTQEIKKETIPLSNKIIDKILSRELMQHNNVQHSLQSIHKELQYMMEILS